MTSVAASQSGREVPERALSGQASAQAPPEPLTGAWPRLLTLPRAADYLGLKRDVVRELAANGELRQTRVRVPAPVTAKRKGSEIGRVLLDRLEIDRLVSAWRERL